ncbi:MAG TPA: hypothetical protein VMB80_09315 [Candidatus Acidoferrum sp.]|nr:hypothetical protein [Candidatus Acidoferrum sp.]
MKKSIVTLSLILGIALLVDAFELKFIDTIHQRGAAIDVYVVVNSTNDADPPRTRVIWYVDQKSTAAQPDGKFWPTAWTNTVQLTNVAVGDMVFKKNYQ